MRARRLPSTSTFTVPSGRRSSWMIVPTVPTSKMSSGVGSLVLAFFCAARKISLSLAHRLFERGDRLLAADEQRHHHVREHDDVAQRQKREHVRRRARRFDRCASFLKNIDVSIADRVLRRATALIASTRDRTRDHAASTATRSTNISHPHTHPPPPSHDPPLTEPRPYTRHHDERRALLAPPSRLPSGRR